MMMDVFRRTSLETTIWAAKLLLLCVGTVSTLLFFRAAIIPYFVNLITSLSFSVVPQLWTSLKSCCLSPLYIYIILNFIIITIVASSTFQRQNHIQNQKHNLSSSSSSSSSSSYVASSGYTKNNAAKTTVNIDTTCTTDYLYSPDNNMNKAQSEFKDDDATISAQMISSSSLDDSNEMISWHDIHIIQPDHKQLEAEDQQIMSTTALDYITTTTSTSAEKNFFVMEHCEEKPMEAEVEAGEDDDVNTLDTTWKAIMEGQGKPMGKQLKKSDTWDTPPRLTAQVALTNGNQQTKGRQLHRHSNLDVDAQEEEEEEDAMTWARRELKKSDTFSDRVSLRREKSLTQEELNQRAEAFIKKFNNDIRLQRLESDQRRFRETVNRSTTFT